MIAQLASRDEPPSDMNGVVRPVSGMTRVTPPMTTNTWKPDREGQADGEQLAEPVAHAERGADAALDRRPHRGPARARDPEEAELLAEAGEDEVAVGEGDEPGPALPEPGAGEAARGHAPEALGQLVGLLERGLREGVEPQVDALLEVRRRSGSAKEAPAAKSSRPMAIQLTRSVAT